MQSINNNTSTTQLSHYTSFVHSKSIQPQIIFPKKKNCLDIQDSWYRLKDRYIEPSTLGKKLRLMSSDADLSLHYDEDIPKIMCEAFQSTEYSQCTFFISKIFKRLSDVQLHGILKALFKDYSIENPVSLISKLKGLCTLQKIENLVRMEFPHFQSVDALIETFNAGKNDKKLKKIDSQNNLERMICHFLSKGFECAFNVATYFLHLKEFFGPNNYFSDGYMADRKYMAFRENLKLFEGWLLAVGVYTGSLVLGGFLTTSLVALGCIVAYVYFKYLKPCPDTLPPFKNLTNEALNSTLPLVYGREKEIQLLIDALCANNATTRKHPILLGQTRVGKTEIINGLAQRIAAGNVPDVLKGKKVFSINSVDMLSSIIFERFQNAILGYENECIFFFDEIHAAFRNSANRFLMDKFKTLMDPSKNSLKYCIFATTQIEFDKYFGEDAAMVARLNPLKIHPLDDRYIPEVLNDMVAREASDLVVEQEAIEEIAKIRILYPEFFGSHSQPATSKIIFSQLIAKARNYHPQQEEKELQNLRHQKAVMKYAHEFADYKNRLLFTIEGMKRQSEYRQINTKIHQLENEITAKKAEIERFFKLVEYRNQLKMAIKGKIQNLTHHSSETQKNEFLMEYYFLQMALDAKIEIDSQKFPKATINKKSAQKIIKKEIAKEAKKLAALTKNKEAVALKP